MRKNMDCCQGDISDDNSSVIGVSYQYQNPDGDPEEYETLERSKTIEDVVTLLKEGTFLWKVRSINKWFRRRYYLDTEQLRICYDTSYKSPCLEGDLHIDLADMVDVRKGWKTDVFNKVGTKVEKRSKKTKAAPMVEEKNCFSIIYGKNKRTLDLVAADEVTCDNWVKGLTHLLTVMKSLEQEKDYETWLKNQFNEADLDRTGSLNFSECLKLLKQLNITMSERHTQKLFEDANTNKREKNGEQVLDANEFVTFYYSLLKRPELEDLFKKYCRESKNVMGPEELMEFLKKEEKMFVTLEEAQYTIETFEYSDLKKKRQLSLSGFVNMMLSEKFEIFNYEHRVVYQDMTRPLSHYYVASSHNTYLLGNQLSGKSSVEAYVSALKTGCRCVEVDCWDGDDGEPIIYHGHTLTSKILFKEVLSDALKPYAFEMSEYPVILSMENHCTEEQQSKLARYLSEILGDMLYTNPNVQDLTQLPSPEDLKGKIIVKAKKMAPKPLVDVGDEVDAGNLSDSDDETELPPVDYIDADEKQKGKKEKKPISSILSDLVNICQAVRFRGFDFEKGKCFHMSSFSEGKAAELIESDGVKFVEYNKQQLCRIYPAGTRASSSNYNPIPFWNIGCHIVALNYQTEGKPMFFNSAKFEQNGSCGYVLKPQVLTGAAQYDPNEPLSGDNGKLLKIKVISGQQLPKPYQTVGGEVVDPYVMVKIRGHPEDKQKHRTTYIHDNGFNPKWNESFDIVVKMPELATLYFIVKDHCNMGKNETIGAYACPFTSVQEGYRHVYLKDYAGKYLTPASLFVHISIFDAY